MPYNCESDKVGIKRTFGEYVNARKFHNMTKELIKASLYKCEFESICGSIVYRATLTKIRYLFLKLDLQSKHIQTRL